MDREYLEDYEERENEQYSTFLKRLSNGTFNLEKDIYPPANRFTNLQNPLATASDLSGKIGDLWTQIPFSGSLILRLSSSPPDLFERDYFKISEIPTIIDFIKSTGRLQVTLEEYPTHYEGLDYLDQIFEELNPPMISGPPVTSYGSLDEIKKAQECYLSISEIAFSKLLTKVIGTKWGYWTAAKTYAEAAEKIYIYLKLKHPILAETIENLMVDDPPRAFIMFHVCQNFVVTPNIRLGYNLSNFSLDEIKLGTILPTPYQPQEISFPCEIGQFLLKKLTYAPVSLDACRELMYHYDAYDLRKVQEALNEGIATNNPDILEKNAEELSEILDNIWNDKTLPRRIKGLEIGIPVSMAAIGSVAAGPIGSVGGFLAGLGLNVADRFIDIGTEKLVDKLAKKKAKSYQINIYDFKRKYKERMALDSTKKRSKVPK